MGLWWVGGWVGGTYQERVVAALAEFHLDVHELGEEASHAVGGWVGGWMK